MLLRVEGGGVPQAEGARSAPASCCLPRRASPLTTDLDHHSPSPAQSAAKLNEEGCALATKPFLADKGASLVVDESSCLVTNCSLPGRSAALVGEATELNARDPPEAVGGGAQKAFLPRGGTLGGEGEGTQLRPRRQQHREQQLLERKEYEAVGAPRPAAAALHGLGCCTGMRSLSRQHKQQHHQQQQQHTAQQQPALPLAGRPSRQRAGRGGAQQQNSSVGVQLTYAAQCDTMFTGSSVSGSSSFSRNGTSSSCCIPTATLVQAASSPADLLGSQTSCCVMTEEPRRRRSEGFYGGPCEAAELLGNRSSKGGGWAQPAVAGEAQVEAPLSFLRSHPQQTGGPSKGPLQRRQSGEDARDSSELSDFDLGRAGSSQQMLQAQPAQGPLMGQPPLLKTPFAEAESSVWAGEPRSGLSLDDDCVRRPGARGSARIEVALCVAEEEAFETNKAWESYVSSCLLKSHWCQLERGRPFQPHEPSSLFTSPSLCWPLAAIGSTEDSASRSLTRWIQPQGRSHADPLTPPQQGCCEAATDDNCCCCCSSCSSSRAEESCRSFSSNRTEQETPTGQSDVEEKIGEEALQEHSTRAFAGGMPPDSSTPPTATVAAQRGTRLHKKDCCTEITPVSALSAEGSAEKLAAAAASPAAAVVSTGAAPGTAATTAAAAEEMAMDRSHRAVLRPLWLPCHFAEPKRGRDKGSSNRSRSVSSERRRRSFYSREISPTTELTPKGSKRLRRGPLAASQPNLDGLRRSRGCGGKGGPLMQLSGGPLHAGVLIFDWDDTFFPNSWLAGRNLSLGSDPSEYEEDAPLLRKLMRSGRRVLKAALCIGSVVLVTNAAQGWIEETCKKFLPGLWPTVEPLRRVSARFHFDSPSCESPFLWKRLAFKEEMDRHLSEHKECRTVVSIGDGPHERDALFFLQAEYSNRCRFSCKSLKLTELPSLERLNKQHALLLHSLEDLLSHDDDLDLCVRGPEEGGFFSRSPCDDTMLLSPAAASGSEINDEVWSALGAPTRAALRLLNIKWRRCRRGHASLLRIDHHLSLFTSEAAACPPQIKQHYHVFSLPLSSSVGSSRRSCRCSEVGCRRQRPLLLRAAAAAAAAALVADGGFPQEMVFVGSS
ncbi:hypothetical protein Esti_002849 [Eimeria stiedai]